MVVKRYRMCTISLLESKSTTGEVYPVVFFAYGKSFACKYQSEKNTITNMLNAINCENMLNITWPYQTKVSSFFIGILNILI